MGLSWAAGWALVGVLIGVTLSLGLPMGWFVEVFDAPLPALAVPGFFAGAVFSMVLGIAGRRRRFEELSLSRFAAWGAVGGLLLSVLPLGLGSGLGTGATAVVVGTLTLLSAASASGSLAIARRAEDRQSLGPVENVADVEIAPGEAQELVGRGSDRG